MHTVHLVCRVHTAHVVYTVFVIHAVHIVHILQIHIAHALHTIQECQQPQHQAILSHRQYYPSHMVLELLLVMTLMSAHVTFQLFLHTSAVTAHCFAH